MKVVTFIWASLLASGVGIIVGSLWIGSLDVHTYSRENNDGATEVAKCQQNDPIPPTQTIRTGTNFVAAGILGSNTYSTDQEVISEWQSQLSPCPYQINGVYRLSTPLDMIVVGVLGASIGGVGLYTDTKKQPTRSTKN